MLPRLLHVIDRLERFGGTPTKLANSSRSLRGLIDCSFFCTDALGGMGQELIEDGFDVESASSGRFDLAVVFRLIRRIKRNRPDVIVSHFLKATIVSRLAGLLTGVPVLTYHHGNIQKPLPFRIIDRLTLPLTKRHLVNSNYTRGLIAKRYALAESQIDVLYPYVPAFDGAAPQRSRTRGSFLIGNIAGLNNYKGQDVLLRAFALVQGRYPESRLVIAGEGPRRAELTRLASELLPQGSYSFLGSVKDVKSLLDSLDVFVFPSVDEGFGIAAVEAMLRGVPVIVSDAGALPEIISNDVNGLVVPANREEELAAAIMKLLADRDLAERLSTAAAGDAHQRFSVDSLTAEVRYWTRFLSGL